MIVSSLLGKVVDEVERRFEDILCRLRKVNMKRTKLLAVRAR